MLTSIQLSGQSILINSFQVKAVLKDRAELEMRRKDAMVDSIATQQLLNAYYYKDSALQQSVKALQESDRIGQDYHSLYVETDKRLAAVKKEARKQKVLKWCGFGLAGLIAVLAATR
ncbi:MAG TPA: hypothetical protein PK059_02145 [Cyclobacteriaceae bacterium]|nr:hypothetical protein [Cyclobacteriaceae bacterium]